MYNFGKIQAQFREEKGLVPVIIPPRAGAMRGSDRSRRASRLSVARRCEGTECREAM